MSSIKNLMLQFMDVAKYVVKRQGFKFYSHEFRYSHYCILTYYNHCAFRWRKLSQTATIRRIQKEKITWGGITSRSTKITKTTRGTTRIEVTSTELILTTTPIGPIKTTIDTQTTIGGVKVAGWSLLNFYTFNLGEFIYIQIWKTFYLENFNVWCSIRWECAVLLLL